MHKVKKHQVYYYLGAFLVPFLLVAIFFMCRQITPFGQRNLLISDMGTQYVPFLTDLRQRLLNHDWSFYAFNLSLGDNYFPLMAYYLISPFNLLILLFPASALPLAVSWIIMLKVGVIGVAMALYLSRVYRNQYMTNLLFTTAFACCGFVANYFYTVMWLDALILLPLIACGIQQLVHQNKSALFYWTILATILTNFYLGYMSCLFAILFYLYLILEDNHRQTKLVTTLKTKWRLTLKFLETLILSGLSSAMLLLPTLLGMLQTGKSDFSKQTFLPLPKFGLEAFVQTGVVGSNYRGRLAHTPTIYIGLTITFFAILFFLNKQIERQHRIRLGGLLLTLALSMWLRSLNTIWHMMQEPKGFPYRNTYFFSFILILCAYEAWQNRYHSCPKLYYWAAGLMGSFISLGYLAAWWRQPLLSAKKTYPQLYVGWRYWLLDLLIISLILLILIKYRQMSRRFNMALMLVLCGELLVNFYGSFTGAKTGNEGIYQQNYQIEHQWFYKAHHQTSDFYRVANKNSLINAAYREPYYNYNDLLLFNSRGLDYYSSTINDHTRRMLKRLGYYSKNARRINSFGATELTNSLFSVRYQLTMTKDDYNLFERNDVLPFGFGATAALRHFHLRSHQALANQQRLFQAISGSPAQFYRAPTLVSQQVTAIGKRRLYRLVLKPKKTGQLYAALPNVNIQKATIQVNGKKHKTRIKVDSAAVMSLGYFTAKAPVTLSIETRTKLKQPQRYMATLDQVAFDQAIMQINQRPYQIKPNWRGDFFTGTFTTDARKPYLLLSLPFDPGWQAKVDGQSKKIKRVVGNLSALKVTPGQHHITLRYEVPGLRLGGWLSFVSMSIYLGGLCFESKSRFKHLNLRKGGKRS
ncbi:YfhO family protein [Agrilactobacillus fermenti]|uniref:YfhO family protein n=1 Tax=Agrilactobacillus fermenti TaxID=2586909 RepID=UPI003A5C03DB